MSWRAVTTRQQATSSGKAQWAYGVNTPRYWVIACCHEEHNWWVVAGAMFLSTWKTQEEAEIEARRLNEENASLSAATR